MRLKRYLDIRHEIQRQRADIGVADLATFADPNEWTEYNALTDSAPDIEISPPDDYAPASGADEYGDPDELLEDFGDDSDGI